MPCPVLTWPVVLPSVLTGTDTAYAATILVLIQRMLLVLPAYAVPGTDAAYGASSGLRHRRGPHPGHGQARRRDQLGYVRYYDSVEVRLCTEIGYGATRSRSRTAMRCTTSNSHGSLSPYALAMPWPAISGTDRARGAITLRAWYALLGTEAGYVPTRTRLMRHVYLTAHDTVAVKKVYSIAAHVHPRVQKCKRLWFTVGKEGGTYPTVLCAPYEMFGIDMATPVLGGAGLVGEFQAAVQLLRGRLEALPDGEWQETRGTASAYWSSTPHVRCAVLREACSGTKCCSGTECVCDRRCAVLKERQVVLNAMVVQLANSEGLQPLGNVEDSLGKAPAIVLRSVPY
eukprot:1068884-Rhodomonas_salina.3